MSDPTLTEDLSRLKPAGAPPARRTLVIVYSPDPTRIGARGWLPDHAITIGREAPDFEGRPLGDLRMSGRHLDVEAVPGEPDTLMFRDRGSKNGTFQAGRRVSEGRWRAGEVLQVGRTFLTYVREPPFEWRAPASLLAGLGAEIHALREVVGRAGRHAQPVLITGPSGAGKEPTAREVHRCSGRRGAFVPVNCGALPAELVESELFGHVAGAFTGAHRAQAGLFAAAERGTLFLDEIGELPLALQPKLLRVIQEGAVRPVGATAERAVDVRIVAATHRDPVALVASGGLRHDLYARLAGALIRVPALAEHREDVPLLAQRALDAVAGPGLTLAPELVWALWEHPWPLNVRALERVIGSGWTEAQGTVVPLTPSIQALLDEQRRVAVGVAAASRAGGPGAASEARRPRSEGSERPSEDALRQSLQRHGGVVSRVASELGVHRYQLYRWLEAHGIDPVAYR